MGDEGALQRLSHGTSATAPAAALVARLLSGDHSLETTIEMLADHFTALPRVEVFGAVLTSFPPRDPAAWRQLGERAWVREWQAPGSTCSVLPPPEAGPEGALSMPWISQYARTDVVALVDADLLPDAAAQDRRELEAAGIRSFVTTTIQSHGQMYGSLSLVDTQPGRWPEEHIADLRLLNAALGARISLEQARRSLADSVATGARTREVNEQLLASVGHELRTPLTSAVGHAEMLLDEASRAPDHPLADAVRRDGRVVLEACERLLDVVDGLLEAGRTLRADTARQHVDVASAVDDVRHWHRAPAQTAGVVIESDVDATMTVWAHPSGLRHVLSILVGNAVEHNRRGGQVHITARPMVGEAGEDRLRVVVRDTGPGLERDQLRELFTPTGRVDGTDADSNGHGLDLPLSRSLAERDSGSIGAESSLGVGTSFWVELPVAPPVAEA